MANSIQAQPQQQLSPTNRINNLINNKAIVEMFETALGENTGAFLTSVVELYSDPTGTLKECNEQAVLMEALKAATLKLPLNKNLGFAYIIPYAKNTKNKQTGKWAKEHHPQFQMGYKGFIQLAQRSGQYRTINAGAIYEGMDVEEDYLTGEVKITGKPENDKAIGYFCHFELHNGFRKTLYWTKEQVTNHAAKFSQGYQAMVKAKSENQYYKSDNYVWDKDFDGMAIKTVTKRLISKYGPLSTDMQKAFINEADDELEGKLTTEANSISFEVVEAEFEDVEEDEAEALPQASEVKKEASKAAPKASKKEQVRVDGLEDLEELDLENAPF